MKSYFFAFLLFFTAGAAFAQSKATANKSTVKISEPKARYSVGAVPVRFIGLAGLNNSKIEASGEDSGIKDGFIFGALAEFGAQQLVLETGLMFTQMGGVGTMSTNVGPQNVKLKNNYLALPIFAKWYADKNQTGVYGKAGVVLMDRTSSKARVGTENIDVDHYVKNEDFMWGVGAGYNFAVATKYDMFVELAFLQGTHRVMENGGPKADDSTRNQSISLRTGIRL